MRLGDRFGPSSRRWVVVFAVVALFVVARFLDTRRAVAEAQREAAPPITTESVPPPASAAVASDPPPPGIKLELSVRVACDEELRREVDWERRMRQRVEQASEVFEKRFGIRWRIKDVVDWNSDDAAPTLAALLDQLNRDVEPDAADVVLGFSGQLRGRGGTRDYEHAGEAMYLCAWAVVVMPPAPEDRNWRLGALVHELGHLLGAWHAESNASVMYMNGDRLTYDVFDAPAAAMIEMVRDAGFLRGVGWIDDARRARIREIYKAGHAADELPPTVAFALWRGEQALVPPVRRDEARRELRRALAEQEQCVDPGDESLVRCLMSLSRALRTGDAGERDEAARLERRACDILVAANVRKRQNRPRDERAPSVPK